ncbi:MAG TPA: hypothetical protein VD816_00435, partial [Ohtaekwangia sp.]|nr:hypothetical protein [Ohtaekwangia sp.]
MKLIKRREVGRRLKAGLFTSFALLLAGNFGYSQCVGLPPVSSLGSNKIPIGLCAPVDASLTYNIIFTSPVTNGTLELVYNWGDGTPDTVVPFTIGDKKYSSALDHNFPTESDCEYVVAMTMRYNGVICTNTRQTQKVASWQTEGHNGGSIVLMSPVTKSTQHIVCEGTPVDVIFEDESEWNCSAEYTANSAVDPIETPNQESRWQQIVYNTGVSDNLIPGLAVDGVPVTGTDGASMLHGYQDPRGVYHMTAPVVVLENRKRASLRITAPGGYGTGFPKAGQTFELTLRYWNFCNPYDDPAIPGPPNDPVNGDHPPVESKAFVKIQAAPAALHPNSESVCLGTTPSPFRVTGVPANATIQWYANIAGSDEPGVLISTGTKTTLPVTIHPEWEGNVRAGVYKAWASYTPRVAGAVNCESPKTLITRIVREELPVPDPLHGLPASVCNQSTFTVTMPPSLSGQSGSATRYQWTGSEGVVLSAVTDTTATFKVNITRFENGMHADRTVAITREYTTAPQCASSRTFTFKVFQAPLSGTITAVADVCETTAVDTLRLAGDRGRIVRWEMKKENGTFETYLEGETKKVSPGLLLPGVYTFRAVVANGPCAEVYSNEQTVTVFKAADAVVSAGEDQFICTSLSSVSLGASDPFPGTGKWSYVSSVPTGLPAPAFSTNLQ